jgi:hypothetical protein
MVNGRGFVLNRKGDVTITTVILIILGLAVLIFLIIGFTKGFDFFFGKFDDAPGSALETVAQSCKIAAEANLLIDFCRYRVVEVNGKDNLLNCRHPTVLESLRATSGANFDSGVLTCGEVPASPNDDKIKAACNELISKNKLGEVKVNNGAYCSTYVSSCVGNIVINTECSKMDGKKTLCTAVGNGCVYTDVDNKCGPVGVKTTALKSCFSLSQALCDEAKTLNLGCEWKVPTA